MGFKALLSVQDSGQVETTLVDLDDTDLMPGDITVDVDYSTINFKDANAITGRAAVIQSFPLIPGIDLSGTVVSSRNAKFDAGERIVVNGWGLSQDHHGGLAQRARIPGEWAVKLPDRFSTRDAMAIGTAGYTAMLSILALEHGGVMPGSGPILVTGANGGVGSIAIALLSDLGYEVIASTGRTDEVEYLRYLGADHIIDRATLSDPGDPVGAERWAGAVDSAGSHTLANVLAQTRPRGVVAAVGLAQGVDLATSVLPFILRGVTLAGIDSVNAPMKVREEAWSRLSDHLDLSKLAVATQVVGLGEVPGLAETLLAGNVRGRIVVDVNAV